METENKKVSKYRPKKKVVDDCLEQGAITETEAKALKKAISTANNATARGAFLIDLKPFECVLTNKFKEKLEKGQLTDKQLGLLHLCRISQISKPHLYSEVEVAECCKKYSEISLEDDCNMNFNGLCLALGITMKELKAIECGEYKTPAQQVIVSYIQLLATQNEQQITDKNSTGAMFIGKNYLNLQDKSEVVHTEKKEELTPEEIASMYEAMDIVDVESTDKEDKK